MINPTSLGLIQGMIQKMKLQHDSNNPIILKKSYLLIIIWSFIIILLSCMFVLFGINLLSSNVRIFVNHHHDIKEYIVPNPSRQHQPRPQQQEPPQPQQKHRHEQQLPLQKRRQLDTTLFGTLNGYDSGGSSSMCWSTTMLSNKGDNGQFFFSDGDNNNTDTNNTSIYNNTDIDDNNMTMMMPMLMPNASIDTVTDRMYDMMTSSSASSSASASSRQSDLIESELLSLCYNGTMMEIIPLDMPTLPREMLTESDYTFQVTVRMDISTIMIDNLNATATGVIQLSTDDLNRKVLYARLMLCDAIRTGFCNPLRDTRSIIEDNITDYQPSTTSTTSTTTKSLLDQTNHQANNIPNNSTSTKYLYDKNNILLGIIDGPFIVTRWISWPLISEYPNSTIFTSSVNVTVRLPKGTKSGAYFFIGHAAITLFNTIYNTMQRIDIAAALSDNVVGVSDPPTILYVTKAMTIILGITIGTFGTISFIMFLYILYHHNHTIIRLAQGRFLAAIVFMCFIQITFTFTVLPTNDIFCVLHDIFYLIPETIVGAILVARMWRAYSILHKAQRIGGGNLRTRNNKANNNNKWECTIYFEQNFVDTLTFLADPISSIVPSKYNESLFAHQGGIRSQIGARYSITLIVLLSLPQILLDSLTPLFYDINLTIEYNDDETIGRYVCDMGNKWSEPVGLAYTAFIFILAVCMAWISRSLPSVFNEKDEVFRVASISALLVFVGLAFMYMMDEPTTNPDVMVLLKSALNIGSVVSVLKIMIYPKLLRVYRNEKVVMGAVFQSKFSLESASLTTSNHHHHSMEHEVVDADHQSVPEQQYPSAIAIDCNNSTGLVVHDDDNNDKMTTFPQSSATTTISSENASNPTTINHQDSKGLKESVRKIIIREGDPLPNKVEREIHQLQILLKDLSDHMCDGRALSNEEFLLLREEVTKLQRHLMRINMEVEPS